MFTGIIQTTGIVRSLNRGGEGGTLVLKPETEFTAPVHGESIAVNGVCLTLERANSRGELEFHTLAETLRRSNLGAVPVGGRVNLERALAVGDRLGGHLVSGHIDGVVKMLAVRRPAAGGDWEFELELPEQFAPLVVEKGSVALDGVSLTVARLTGRSFTVCIIPVTLAETALTERRVGDGVNLELDIIGKYVRSILTGRSEKLPAGGGVTMEKLMEAGF